MLKTLYLECNMGAAGDMILGALLELTNEPDIFLEKLNAIGLDGIRFEKRTSIKRGISGTHADVFFHGQTESAWQGGGAHAHGHNNEAGSHTHEHGNETGFHTHEHSSETEHHSHKHDSGEDSHSFEYNDISGEHGHTTLNALTKIIGTLSIPAEVKENAIQIYNIVAEAEAAVHGKPVSMIHFHELGDMDAVADIVGVCMLINELAPERIIVSPINTGSGFVRCAHGLLPVPAPATANILKGIPIYAGNIKGELITPTGAAIIKHFAQSFGGMPEMSVEKIGYGMGSKDFEACNCVRAFWGLSREKETGETAANDEIAELSCNIDDMTAEALGFAFDLLLENGAQDVFTLPAQMKKNRHGHILVCMCRPNEADKFAKLILKHTTTFGVRMNILKRYVLEREISALDTAYGPLRIKTGKGFGILKTKPEFDDCAKAAKKYGVDIKTVYDCAAKAEKGD